MVARKKFWSAKYQKNIGNIKKKFNTLNNNNIRGENK